MLMLLLISWMAANKTSMPSQGEYLADRPSTDSITTGRKEGHLCAFKPLLLSNGNTPNEISLLLNQKQNSKIPITGGGLVVEQKNDIIC